MTISKLPIALLALLPLVWGCTLHSAAWGDAWAQCQAEAIEAGHLLVSTVVSGGLHVASEKMGADVIADADRAAKGIAKQLSALFAREGWTS